MIEYYIEEYGGVFCKLQTPAAPHPGQALLGAAESDKKNDLSEFNKIWTSGDIYDIDFKYQLYTETIHNLLINHDKYKICDVFYIEHKYETRQYYGLGRISYDIENNKKILIHHEDDGFCIHDKIFPKLLQELIDEKPNFYENVLKIYEEYFVE